MSTDWTDVKDQLLQQLDDASQTAFTDAKLYILVNEALKFLLDEMFKFRQYFRSKEAEITVTSGTAEYALTSATAAVFTNDPYRRPILVERTDSDLRRKGTIIVKSQRNLRNVRWNEPIVYFRYEDGDWYLCFASKDEPSQNMTLTLTYAPTALLLTSGNAATYTFEDIPDDYINLLLLRATFMGLGEEKNADQFWVRQYEEGLRQAKESWSDEVGLEYVLEVDGYEC
jgi:hypothetical protein